MIKRYTDLDLRNALAEFAETGLLCNFAENYSVPFTTLFNRVRGSGLANKSQIIK